MRRIKEKDRRMYFFSFFKASRQGRRGRVATGKVGGPVEMARGVETKRQELREGVREREKERRTGEGGAKEGGLERRWSGIIR